MLECESIKKGIPCPFMSKTGCKFNGGCCHPIVDKCEGCAHVMSTENGNYCRICPDPAAKWRFGRCNFATHIKNGNGKNGNGKWINPLKASKRKAKSK